jgi:hypothetical protein
MKPKSRLVLVFILAVGPALSQSLTPPAGITAPPLRPVGSAVPLLAVDGIGDFDNDGDLDLIQDQYVCQNDGNATFTLVYHWTLLFSRSRMEVADLDGNGSPDILSTDGFSVAVRTNAGGLHFNQISGLPALSPAGVRPNNVAIGDVDQDGDLDAMIGTIIPSTSAPSTPNLWLNDGFATFTPAPANVPATSVPSTTLIMHDVDADGDADAIFGGSGAASAITFLKNANGVFSIANQWTFGYVTDVDVGDFDADGLFDIGVATHGGIAVNMSSPTGYLGFSPLSGLPMLGIRAVDVTGDNRDEILLQDSIYGGMLSLHAIGASGVAGPAIQSWAPRSFGLPGLPGRSAIRDLDGDGDRDAVVLGSWLPSLLMNTANGAFVYLGDTEHQISLTHPHVGDVNGDGHPDVLGFPTALISQIAVGLNDGEGAFRPGPSTAITLPGGAPPWHFSLHPFDRDGDGDSDVYAARNVHTSISPATSDVLFDNQNGAFVPIANVTGTGDASAVRSADFDGDGDQDLLLGRRLDATLTTALAGPMLALRNDGAAGFSAPIAIGTGHATWDLDLGDFDGDGFVDVFQTNRLISAPASDPCVVYLNAAGSGFTPLSLPISGNFAVAADFSGDGLTDVIVDATTILASGGGGFVQGTSLSSPLAAPSMAADLDHDGDIDIVESELTVRLNLGNGTFWNPIPFLPYGPGAPTYEAPTSWVLDLDHDGDSDVFTAPGAVWTNHVRQITRGPVPRHGRPVSIELFGSVNTPWLLFASNGTAQFQYAPYGTVLIDPASAVLGASGLFDAGWNVFPGNIGYASLSGILPNNPALVGWTSYWQAVDVATLRVTNRLKMTVLGY